MTVKKYLIISILLLALLLCSCGIPSISDIIGDKDPEGTVYTKTDVYGMTEEEFKAYLQDGGYEKHLKAIEAEGNLYEDFLDESGNPIMTSGEPFDQSTSWESGLQVIDWKQMADDLGYEEDDDGSGDSADEIPAQFKQYFPTGMKANYAADVFGMLTISIDCSKDAIVKVCDNMTADGYEIMSNIDQDGTFTYMAAKKGAYQVTVTWGDGSAVLMYTDISSFNFEDEE